MELLLLAAVAKPLESFSLVSKFTCVRNADVTLQCLFDQSGNTLFFRNVFICQVSYDHRSFYLSRLFLLQKKNGKMVVDTCLKGWTILLFFA